MINEADDTRKVRKAFKMVPLRLELDIHTRLKTYTAATGTTIQKMAHDCVVRALAAGEKRLEAARG